METVVGVISAGAVLLVIAGAQKMIDPWPAATALRNTGLPSSRSLVRAGAAVEILLGVAFLVFGSSVLSLAIAALYLAFTAFVVLAMRAGVDGSCGCFGREDTPPSSLHIAANVGLAVVAVVYAMGDAAAPVDVVAGVSFASLSLVAATGVLVALLIAVYSLVPRLLAALELAQP